MYIHVVLLCIVYMYFLPSLATGTLKGYDQLLNLVLDNTVEHMRGKPVTMTTATVFYHYSMNRP